MSIKYTIIVLGEPYSVFSEIIAKYFSKKRKLKKKIILIGNKDLLIKQIDKLKYKLQINEIEKYNQAKKNLVNIININFKYKKVFTNISEYSNNYIQKCFSKSLEIVKNKKDKFVLINGPISKKTFLKKKFSGITEYLSSNTNSKNEVMLIYNSKFSVCPLTTHIPIKKVNKKINKNKIKKCILNINNFYKRVLGKNIKIAVLGLNPHCETTDAFSEEEKIIIPSIKLLQKKRVKVYGPFSADTFFIKKNIEKYDVAVGMYHDQVLTPMKTIFNFKAINITIGLPFVRISPDHGPNSAMLGKNKSDPSSFFYAMNFAEKI